MECHMIPNCQMYKEKLATVVEVYLSVYSERVFHLTSAFCKLLLILFLHFCCPSLWEFGELHWTWHFFLIMASVSVNTGWRNTFHCAWKSGRNGGAAGIVQHYTTCQTSTRSWFQFPVHIKKERKVKKRRRNTLIVLILTTEMPWQGYHQV